MYRIYLLLFCLLPVLSVAQAESDPLTEGVLAYEKGDYPESIQLLASLIETENQIPAYQLPRAHFFLSQAYWKVHQEASLRNTYPEALLRAYNHLTAAKRLDLTGRYQTMSDLAIASLLPAMLQAGKQAYNRGDYPLSIRYFNRIHQLQPNNFEAVLARGYAQWQTGDSLKAVNSWQRAIRLSPKPSTPQVGDSTLVQAFVQLVKAYSQWGQVSRAKELLLEAKQRYLPHPDLQEAELAMYLQHPVQLANGRQHFQELADRNPKNEDIRFNYARYLFYSGDTSEAVVQLYRIVQRNDQNLEATRFLASHYVQQAHDLMERTRQAADFGQDSRKDAISDQLLEAIPFLKILHEAEPTEAFWLEELIAIGEYVGLPELENYREKLQQIR